MADPTPGKGKATQWQQRMAQHKGGPQAPTATEPGATPGTDVPTDIPSKAAAPEKMDTTGQAAKRG